MTKEEKIERLRLKRDSKLLTIDLRFEHICETMANANVNDYGELSLACLVKIREVKERCEQKIKAL